MGIAFITDKAQKFKQQRDAAFEDQLSSDNLLSRLPDTSRTTYRCKSAADASPEVGTPVLLYRTQDKVNVYEKNLQIGAAMPADATELMSVMGTMNTDVLAAKVVEVRSENGIFLIQLNFPTP